MASNSAYSKRDNMKMVSPNSNDEPSSSSSRLFFSENDRLRETLKYLFRELHQRGLIYVLLRGYENITAHWNIETDLDFAVAREHLQSFLMILFDVAQRQRYENVQVLFRPGVLGLLFVDNESKQKVPIDIWYEFRYVGFEYLDVNNLLIKRRQLESGIYIPSCEYEVAALLLKELLHVGKISDEKLLSARKKIDSRFGGPFERFFHDEISNELAVSVQRGVGEVSILRKKALLACMSKNVCHFGILKVLSRTIEYILARFWGFGNPISKLKNDGNPPIYNRGDK